MDTAVKPRNDGQKIKNDKLLFRNRELYRSYRGLTAVSMNLTKVFQKSKIIHYFVFQSILLTGDFYKEESANFLKWYRIDYAHI